MRKLYTKTAEKMAEAVRYYLMLASDDYEKKYSAYLAAGEKVKSNLKSDVARQAFDELFEKMNEKLTQELLRTILILTDSKREVPLFTLNTTYIMRNGEILTLRNRVAADLYFNTDILIEFENAHKKLTAFHLGTAKEYISELFENAYEYYC